MTTKYVRPGQRNLLTDVDTILVGQSEDQTWMTGVTVILPEKRCVAAVDVRGGAPGTRDTDALQPDCLVTEVDGVVLSGGSVHGLQAAGGVTDWLTGAGRGFPVAGLRVPVVPGAIIFDLLIGDQPDGTKPNPWYALGRHACERASREFSLGNAGAGLGARAGSLKGGVGSVSAIVDGLQVGALAVVNSWGNTVVPGTRMLWAAPFELQGEMGTPPRETPDGEFNSPMSFEGLPGSNTTIAVAATNACLTRSQAQRIAIMCHDGLARAIHPFHTPFDGDTVFVLATSTLDRPIAPVDVCALGTIAADCMTRAVGRAMISATTVAGVTSYNDWLNKS